MHARRTASALLVLVLLAGCEAPPPPAPPAQAARNCARIADALRTCTPAACEEDHLFVIGATSAYEIVGEEGGRCVYTETIAAGQTLMRCRMSESERRAYADSLTRYWRGDLQSGPQLQLDCEYLDR